MLKTINKFLLEKSWFALPMLTVFIQLTMTILYYEIDNSNYMNLAVIVYLALLIYLIVYLFIAILSGNLKSFLILIISLVGLFTYKHYKVAVGIEIEKYAVLNFPRYIKCKNSAVPVKGTNGTFKICKTVYYEDANYNYIVYDSTDEISNEKTNKSEAWLNFINNGKNGYIYDRKRVKKITGHFYDVCTF